MITLHTYGDSHSTFFGAWSSGTVDGVKIDGVVIEGLNIKTNHIAGKLAYSFGRDQMEVVKDVNEHDIVVFCFGEIDCRFHINKYEPNWEKSIDDLVENYFRTIDINVKSFPKLKVCVYNVVPPLERENPLNLWTEVWGVNNGVPATGTDEDRKRYTIYMNKKLKEYSVKYGYTFFDVYEQYSNEDGFLKRELSDTNCHIRNPIYMEDFIKNNLL